MRARQARQGDLLSFLSFVDESFMLFAGISMIIGFLVWEVPRSLKLLSEEHEKLIYPQTGRVFDVFLFVVGLLSFVFYLFNRNEVLNALVMPTFSLIFSIAYLGIPSLIFLGFLKKMAKMLDAYQSLSRFMICAFFDFAHTVFFISFSLVFVAIAFFFFVSSYL